MQCWAALRLAQPTELNKEKFAKGFDRIGLGIEEKADAN
jgi:hypothetical protein